MRISDWSSDVCSSDLDIPAESYAYWDGKEKGRQQQTEWQKSFDAYAKAYPAEAAELQRRMRGDLPGDFSERAKAFVQATNQKEETVATRKASQLAITAFAAQIGRASSRERAGQYV